MKRKKGILSKVICFAVALIVMAGCMVAGMQMEVFEDFDAVKETMHFDGEKLLKIVLVVSFLVVINGLIQIILGLFRGKTGRVGTMGAVISSLVKYAIVIWGFCWVLSLIGVNVSTIFASLGIIALILGFGAESLIADVVTGIFILFENQFNIGDIIEVDGFRGVVETIGIRTIGLKDNGGNIKIVNNSDLKNIVNRSESGSVAICEVGVSYSVDLEALEEKIGAILEGIKQRNSSVFIGEVKYLGVENLADSSVVLKFKADVNEKDIFSGRRLLNKEIKCAFDKAGIEIAFPQLDIHNK